MIDDAAAGRTVFYDIYTDGVKQADRSRHNTGLFFFRGKAGAPFAVIAPGGGFAYVGSLHEGFPYAVEISNRGYNAFVLKYRAGRGGTVATEDLAAALSYIFSQRGRPRRHDCRLFAVGRRGFWAKQIEGARPRAVADPKVALPNVGRTPFRDRRATRPNHPST